jgi:group I intron endonuclease
LANGRHGNGPLSNACKKYGIDQLKFEVVLYCDKADLLMYEQRAIDLLKPEYNIFKVAGSPSGYKHTPEAIEKIRAASKNMSLEVREKLRQIGRVRTFSPEHRARIGAANARRVITDESRAKMSASNNSKGRKFSEEARANMRAAQAVRNQKRILLEAEENERHQQRLF